MLTPKTALGAVAAALVLAACGGGDDAIVIDTPPPPPPPVVLTAVPDSAVASSTALTGFLQAQKSDDETTEALTLPSVDIAASDTDEPQSL